MPFAADPAESARAFDARRHETSHEKAARGVSDPPLDVGSARRGSHGVSSPRVLGGDPARRPPAANETEPTPEDEGHGASEGDAGYRGYQASELAAELGVAADAKPVDTPLERKRAAVQATLQRKLREAEARAAASGPASGPAKPGDHAELGTRAENVAKDVTITASTPAPVVPVVPRGPGGPGAPAPTRIDAPQTDSPTTRRENVARGVRTYRAADLRLLNAACDAPPPGFVADPRWATATKPAKPAKRETGAVAKSTPAGAPLSPAGGKTEPGASPAAVAAAAAEAAAAAAASARDDAEAEAARAAASAVLRANTSRWSLWSPGAVSPAAERRGGLADALDPSPTFGNGRFREPEFRAESAAAARAARASAGAANDVATLGAAAPSRISLVSFPADALTQFAAGIPGVLAPPSAARAPTLGILFGSWAARPGGEEAGGDRPLADGAAWQATIAFLQPWEGAAAELTAWLEAEDAARGRAAAPGSVAAQQLRPIGWLRTTAGLGAGVTEEIRHARAAAVDEVRAARAEDGAFSEYARDACASRPPPASAVFVSLDEVRSAVAARHAGGGAGAAAEVYDLRDETAVDFEVDGKDAGEEE